MSAAILDGSRTARDRIHVSASKMMSERPESSPLFYAAGSARREAMMRCRSRPESLPEHGETWLYLGIASTTKPVANAQSASPRGPAKACEACEETFVTQPLPPDRRPH